VQRQQELGTLLDDIGAVSAALEVYLRLQSWENVIACYAKLGYQQKVRACFLFVGIKSEHLNSRTCIMHVERQFCM